MQVSIARFLTFNPCEQGLTGHSLLLTVSPNATVDTQSEAKLTHHQGKRSLSRLVVLVKTSQT